MSGGGKMFCELCGKNITMSGSQMCAICDPDIAAIIERKVKSKTPKLCATCFENHKKSHNPTKPKTLRMKPGGSKRLKFD